MCSNDWSRSAETGSLLMYFWLELFPFDLLIFDDLINVPNNDEWVCLLFLYNNKYLM